MTSTLLEAFAITQPPGRDQAKEGKYVKGFSNPEAKKAASTAGMPIAIVE